MVGVAWWGGGGTVGFGVGSLGSLGCFIIVGRLRHTRSYVMHRAGLLVCEWRNRDSESILKVGEFLQRKEAVEHCH